MRPGRSASVWRVGERRERRDEVYIKKRARRGTWCDGRGCGGLAAEAAWALSQ